MKKTIFLLSVAATIGIFGCNNDNTVNPRPSDKVLGTATITGKAQVELNDTNTTLENVPDGTKVFAIYSSKDLVLNPSTATYPSQQLETTVTGGTYTFNNIPVGPNGINVTLHFSNFRADKTAGGVTTSQVFTAADLAVNGLKVDEVRIQDRTWN